MNPPTNLFAAVPKRSARCHCAFPADVRAEMDALGWDQCDVILVTGDAYIDHPSFGMALVGRLLEAKGYRVGIIAQPDWQSADAFRALGKPRLYYGVTAGNMDSMVNRYTADRKPARTTPTRPTASRTSARTAPSRCTPSAAAKPIRARGDRLDRSLAAPHRPLRLLVGQGAPFGAVRFQGRHADLRQCRARAGRPDRRMADGENIKTIRDLRGTAFLVPPAGCRAKNGACTTAPASIRRARSTSMSTLT
jgi:hypothetical protein